MHIFSDLKNDRILNIFITYLIRSSSACYLRFEYDIKFLLLLGKGGQLLARVPNLTREHFYTAGERGLGNEILSPSSEKVNNLHVAVLYCRIKLGVHFFIFVC